MRTTQLLASVVGVIAATTLVQNANAAQPTVGVAELTNYVGKTLGEVSGKIIVQHAGSTIKLIGMDVVLKHPDDASVVTCTTEQPCGIHVHSGTSCDSETGGHHFTGETDGWASTAYTVDPATGIATIDVVGTDDSYVNLGSVVGRAVTLHGGANLESNNRIACGVIKALPVSAQGIVAIDDVTTSLFIDASLKPYAYAEGEGGAVTHVGSAADTSLDVTWSVRATATHMLFESGTIASTNSIDSPLVAKLYTSSFTDAVCESFEVPADESAFNETIVDDFDLIATVDLKESLELSSIEVGTSTLTVVMTLMQDDTFSYTCVDLIDISVITGHVVIAGDEASLNAVGWADNLSFENGTGGWHVHSGSDCSSAAGHLLAKDDSDPWLGNTYTAEHGRTNFAGEVTQPLSFASGRSVVLHAPDGTRLACGELNELKPSLGAAPMSVYPTGNPAPVTSVQGQMVVSYDDMTGLTIVGRIAGLEADCVDCGVHIHEGYTCATSGGHYWHLNDVDPWAITKYTTDSDGIATVHVNVPAAEFESFAEVAGRALVFHGSNAQRVACGVIHPLGGALFLSSEIGPYEGSLETAAVAQFSGDASGTIIVSESTSETTVNVDVDMTFSVEQEYTITVIEAKMCDDELAGNALKMAEVVINGETQTQASEVADGQGFFEDGKTVFADRAVWIVGEDGYKSCSYLAFKHNVEGFMLAHETNDMLKITVTARELQDLEMPVTNGGWHVHAGTSCTASGGHLLDDNEADPWITSDLVKYNVSAGTVANPGLGGRTIATFSGVVEAAVGQLAFINGKTVVIHALNSAQRMACGEIGAVDSKVTAMPTTVGTASPTVTGATGAPTKATTKAPTSGAAGQSVSVVTALAVTVVSISGFLL